MHIYPSQQRVEETIQLKNKCGFIKEGAIPQPENMKKTEHGSPENVNFKKT